MVERFSAEVEDRMDDFKIIQPVYGEFDIIKKCIRRSPVFCRFGGVARLHSAGYGVMLSAVHESMQMPGGAFVG